MQVMITGGTGFVGSHAARELIGAGHRVRLLIRDEAKARRVFGELGIATPPWVKGDMTDPAGVARAMEGCDAAVHAAALVTMDSSAGERMIEQNSRGTAIVLEEACRRGMKSILYVSSIAALEGRGAGPIGPDAPLSASHTPYRRSKTEAEAIARSLQEKGHPLSIVYPSAVLGPCDPGLSEANAGIRTMVRLCGLVTATGMQFIDVRDLARIIRLLLEKGESGRYCAGGIFQPWRTVTDQMRAVTGRRIPRVTLPGFLFRGAGRAVDAIQRILPLHLEFSLEAARFATQWRMVDDSATLARLSMKYREPAETLRDTIAWLARAGHLSEKKAGKALGAN